MKELFTAFRIIFFVSLPLLYLVVILQRYDGPSHMAYALAQENYHLQVLAGIISGVSVSLVIWHDTRIPFLRSRPRYLLSGLKIFLVVTILINAFLIDTDNIALFWRNPFTSSRWLPFHLAYLFVVVLFFCAFHVRKVLDLK